MFRFLAPLHPDPESLRERRQSDRFATQLQDSRSTGRRRPRKCLATAGWQASREEVCRDGRKGFIQKILKSRTLMTKAGWIAALRNKKATRERVAQVPIAAKGRDQAARGRRCLALA